MYNICAKLLDQTYPNLLLCNESPVPNIKDSSNVWSTPSSCIHGDEKLGIETKRKVQFRFIYSVVTKVVLLSDKLINFWDPIAQKYF